MTVPETHIYLGDEKKALGQLDKEELIEFVRNLIQQNRVLNEKYEVLKACHFGSRYDGHDSSVRNL